MNILSYIKEKLKESLNKSTNTSTSSGESSADKLKQLESFIGDKYNEFLPEKSETPVPPSYERYEYEAPTDESIKESAEAELSGYASSNENSIRNQYDKKAKELEANKAASEKLFTDSSQKLKEAYGEAAEALNNDALKRGLARSSIALNNQAAASNAFAKGVNELILQRNEKIAALDDEINSLSGQLQSALDSFKISYAAKLTERINELKEEREKHKLEALKYNNSLLSDEYKQQLEKEKTDSSLYSDALSSKKREQEILNSLTDDQKADLERSIYGAMVEVLDSMPLEEARKAVRDNPLFRNNLSETNYYMLYYRYN